MTIEKQFIEDENNQLWVVLSYADYPKVAPLIDKSSLVNAHTIDLLRLFLLSLEGIKFGCKIRY